MYLLSDLDRQTPRLLSSVADPRHWRSRRTEVQKIWSSYIGALPSTLPAEINVLHEEATGGVIRQQITYAAPGVREVPAYLLIPDPISATPVPAVVALHQTTRMGKDEPAGVGGAVDMRYGLELARRGYVVLAADTVGMGDRADPLERSITTTEFYKSDPDLSAVGRMITDHRQGVDVLMSLPFVDKRGVGAIGHSLGGYSAFFLAGADDRVLATVCSCGFGMFGEDPRPERWCRTEGFNHIPLLADDLQYGRAPWEWHEILALVAPRAMLISWDEMDEVFSNGRAIDRGLGEIAELYRVLGCAQNVEIVRGQSGHSFPYDARRRAYDFLDRILHPAGGR